MVNGQWSMVNDEISQLIERFLNAQTTEAEEQTLAEYFQSAESVPEEWQPVRELFLSFQTDAYDLTDAELAALTAEPAPTKRKIAPLYWFAAAAACAAILFIIGSGVIYNDAKRPSPNPSLAERGADAPAPQDNEAATKDSSSYAPAPTEHPLYLRGGAKLAALHQDIPATEDVAQENSEDDSPSKIEGVDAEQTGAYDNANLAYTEPEPAEPEPELMVCSETDMPVTNPQNLIYTEEDIQKLQEIYRQRIIAQYQNDIEISRHNLRQLKQFLASN